jgi:cell division protein FtsW (lipid II flippase)
VSGRRAALVRLDELQLVLLAALLAIVGAITIGVGTRRDASVSLPDLRHGLVAAGLVVAVSLGWTLVRHRGDQLLLPIVGMLSMIGYLELLRLQPDLARQDSGFASLAQRQLFYLAGGAIVLFATGRFFRHWHLLRRYRYTLLLLCIGLLLATFVFGTPIYGARLWITVGPIQIQPSEIIKVGLVLFLASYLDENRELIGSTWQFGPLRLPPIPYLLPMALMWGTSLIVLVVENDLGSALLLFSIFLVMLYVGTGRTLYVLIGFVTFAAACWLALTLFNRIDIRVNNWLDPWWDPLDAGYQQIQSDYAIASGGVLGVGLSAGQPWRIPVVQTDFIFSAFAEETGLAGAVALLGLYGLLVARGFHIALRAADSYLRLVAVGLSASLGVQTAVILGGVLRLIPLTGITLPFVSYGGSSMLTNFLIVGLLANISAHSVRDRPNRLR